MEESIFKISEIVPCGDMFYCERKTFINTNLILPGQSEKSPASTLLVIKKMGPDCKEGKVGDILLMKPRASVGIIELDGNEYNMVSEKEVGLFLRRPNPKDSDFPQPELHKDGLGFSSQEKKEG